jgi:hypothetical protein
MAAAGQGPLTTAPPTRTGRTLPHWPKAARSGVARADAKSALPSMTIRPGPSTFPEPDHCRPGACHGPCQCKRLPICWARFVGTAWQVRSEAYPVSSLQCGHDWDAAARRGLAAATPGWHPRSRDGRRPWQGEPRGGRARCPRHCLAMPGARQARGARSWRRGGCGPTFRPATADTSPCAWRPAWLGVADLLGRALRQRKSGLDQWR